MNFNNNDTISIEKRFRLLFLILRLSGIPVCMKKISKLYYLYSVMVTTSLYAVYVGSCLDTFVQGGDSKQYMSTVRVWSSFSFITFIHIVLSIRRYKIEELICFTESFIWEDLPTRDSETGYLTQAGLIKRITKIIKWALIMFYIFHATQSTFRVIKSRETVFNVWYPFDFYSSPTYEALLISHVLANIVCVKVQILFARLPPAAASRGVHLKVDTCFLRPSSSLTTLTDLAKQILASIPAITVIMGFMLLYSTLVVITGSQLEKLRGKLMAIKWINVVSQEESFENEKNICDEMSQNNQKTFRLMLNQLKNCVKLHQLILSYMEMLENNLHLVLGGTLLINLLALLLCAFSVVTNWGDFTDISQGVGGYAFYVLNLYIICSTGSEVNKEAEKVRDAAWDCDWIGTPIPFQRSVMFIIARANKTFTFTAAKFVPVSMITFMNIMQQTLSYFMFLLEMKNSNNITEENSPN